MLNNLVPTSPHNDDDGTFLYNSTTSAEQLHASRLSIVKPWFAFSKVVLTIVSHASTSENISMYCFEYAVLLVVAGGVN